MSDAKTNDTDGVTREVKLERVKFYFQQAFSENLIDYILLDWRNYFDTYVLEAVVRFFADDEYSETITYPVTWWDAFKDRWFPKWLQKRFPVNYKVHEISSRVIYPKLKVQMPDRNPVFKIWHTPSEYSSNDDE